MSVTTKMLIAIIAIVSATQAFAAGPALTAEQSIANLVPKIKPELELLAAQKDVIADLKAQNAKPLTDAQAKKVEALWQSKKLEDLEKLNGYIHNPTGAALRATMAKIPLSKCFTLDKQGNVAGTEPKCHDFMHGTQPKFLDCFKSGKMVVNKPAKDLTSGKFSVQISMPVKDGKETIGVLVATFPLEIN